ncbi:hypothetical protein D3P08_20470 [Paenibacillus nanensis]|uniref:2-keto-3-deoxygluconate kinase n=1 Tax=Paenibacillus nanensis TaxID=393251 RepID=A0A3A1US49_9BACL|nr:hypothetical protein [Paenibacillus nanensis]RIX50231.1 hypothetical protein D3P08_20470 [Paenibacillus nanensis]
MKEIDGRLRGGKHHGGGHKGERHHHHGAQTFRRGRALEFLERLTIKRNTLRQQLSAPEFQEIKPMLQGELKALELVMEEFVRHFELHEIVDSSQQKNQEKGQS